MDIKFYVKPVSLINKLEALSYQSTSNAASQRTPKVYNTTGLLTQP